jgi:hypothetical protein
VGRVRLLHLTEVTWKTGGTAEISTKSEKNVDACRCLSDLFETCRKNRRKFISGDVLVNFT